MNTQLTTEESESERLPREAALLLRLRVFVNLRWLAIVGIIIATLVASRVYNISFPILPVYIICGVIALYNLVLLRQLQSLKQEQNGSIIPRARTYGNLHIVLDLLTLTVLLHFTGGIENPFVFYFVFHVIMASIVLSYKTVYLLVSSVLFLVALLVGLEYAAVIPHVNLEGFAEPTLYKQASYFLAVFVALASILYGTAYMATAVAGELRKRQRQVVQLREDLIQEKTRELELSTAEVAKLEAEKEQFLRFLSIAAHDLKAPLTAIQGFIWVMLGGYSGSVTDKQKDMLERSSRRINELLALISDLLDIPRIETGQIVQEMKDFSLLQVVRNCVEDARKLAEEKGLKLEAELPETLPEIYGSAPRLQQVVTNLVHNAITYTSEGSITIKVKEDDDNVVVETTDSGIGIPPEDLPKLFADFFRASNVTVKGTGLGLSIAKRIVEAHNGKIWVESPSPETGKGSKFTFILPKKTEGR